MSDQPILQESSLKTADIRIDALVANPRNVNEMSENKMARLMKEISEVGFLVPLNVIALNPERTQFFILGGEHRWRASKNLNMSYVTCVIHEDERFKDMDVVDLVSFRLNIIRGDMNSEKFFQMYKHLCDQVGPDKVQDQLGITDSAEFKKLTKNIQASLKAQGAPQEVIDDVSKAGKKAKTPEELSTKISKILKNYSESMMTQAIIFQSQTGESIFFKAETNTFRLMKLLVDHAHKTGKNVNEILAPALDALVNNLN
jgi:ParB/RepB/Spo0J family partition protein